MASNFQHMGGAGIEIQGLSKHFGEVRAVDDVSLQVQPGEFLALLGPSGSGKTSILMSIAGFELPDAGRITIDGRDVTYLTPGKRNLGMVFQKYSLFPHLSGGRRKPWPRCAWMAMVSACPLSSRAGNSSAWPLRARSSTDRRCC